MHWDPEQSVTAQDERFQPPQAALQAALTALQAEAERQLAQDRTAADLPKTAHTRRNQVLSSLLTHCRTPDLAPNSMRLDRLKHEAQLGAGVDRPLGVEAFAQRDERLL